MEKLMQVEQAKAKMIEAIDWSVMKWLREKKTVRKIADLANAALDACNADVKAEWPKDLQASYASTGDARSNAKADTDLQSIARRVKHADDLARQARDDAEKTFDDAEKQLSTSLAREGCRKAIKSWELHEKAIKAAESGLLTRPRT